VSGAVSTRPLARSGASMITVDMALRLPSLRRGAPQVVAGRQNLHRRIRWVHSSEVAHIASLLKGDELLLLTGMGIGRSEAAQRRFVADLDARGVAGVVFELGQVFDRLPAPLVDEARTRGLPLVELHREVPFVEVTEELHSNIVNRQVAVLRRADELHRRFTQLLLDGSGIPEVLDVLALTVSNPVLLEKPGAGVLYHAVHHTPADAVLATWEQARETIESSAPTVPGAIVRPVPAAGRRTWGRLVALPLDSPLDDFDRVAVERALPLVALVLLRRQEEARLATRERGNFLADVAAGRVAPADASARAQALGFDAAHASLLPFAAVPAAPGVDGLPAEEADWVPVWRTAREDLERRGTPVVVGARDGARQTLIVVALRNRARRTEAVEAVVDALRAAVATHIGPPEALVVAAGAAVSGWAELAPALRAVAETGESARAAPPRRWHDATAPDLERLLWSLREDDRMDDFITQRLAPVLDHDRRRAAKLMPTLVALCDHAWRKAETARAMHLNRQSLYARIARLETLLGTDLGDPEQRLGIELAVRSWRHRHAR
jgi:purine catabolism regulator